MLGCPESAILLRQAEIRRKVKRGTSARASTTTLDLVPHPSPHDGEWSSRAKIQYLELTVADHQRSSPLRCFKAVPSAQLKPAQDFISFVNDSPTPFHAVHQSEKRKRLELVD